MTEILKEIADLEEKILQRKIKRFEEWAEHKESVIANRTEIAQEALEIIYALQLKMAKTS